MHATDGTRRTLSLGTYPATGLQLARKLATAARAQVAEGLDPSVERKSKKPAVTAQREAETRLPRGEPVKGSIEDVARCWFETCKSGWVDSYSSKVIARLEIHVFPYLGALPMSHIQPKSVLDVCRRIDAQGTIETAHRAPEHCSLVFNFAIAEGADLSNPCRDLKGALKCPETQHFPALTTLETLALLLRSIDAYHASSHKFNTCSIADSTSARSSPALLAPHASRVHARSSPFGRLNHLADPVRQSMARGSISSSARSPKWRARSCATSASSPSTNSRRESSWASKSSTPHGSSCAGTSSILGSADMYCQ